MKALVLMLIVGMVTTPALASDDDYYDERLPLPVTYLDLTRLTIVEPIGPGLILYVDCQ
ncbi:hypothetical protein [Phyllobacterium brassicacearum]|uniref:hypothetical protein n=1 Tax=Phyllobacterium brassicacearum TaxID=314235 RepID=UPI0010ED03AF|nr:hypothetical protein [Phyllobacterium brassicacearum]TDQ32017.1 hypothetical protein DEV91_106114 [Phyllobacterium brassicacearum]